MFIARIIANWDKGSEKENMPESQCSEDLWTWKKAYPSIMVRGSIIYVTKTPKLEFLFFLAAILYYQKNLL